MGILLTNIVAFALPTNAYLNPLAAGNKSATDIIAWAIAFVAIEGKMRGLFSLLFGASMLLILDRVEAAGQSSSHLHFRRMLFLFGFGMLHFWFIWDGDILALYALCGALAFGLRDFSAAKLARLGIFLIAGNMVFWALILATAHSLQMEAMGGTRAAQDAYQQMADALGASNGASIAANISLYQQGYLSIVGERLAEHLSRPLENLFAYGLETLGLIALGMAILKSGGLTGGWSRSRLIRGAVASYAFGLPLSVALAWFCWQQGFDTLKTATVYFLINTPIRMAVLAGHLMLLIILTNGATPGAFMQRVAAAGRMAFSNYILTSLLMTSLFYGYGGGLYAQLSRAEIYLFVPAIWAFMLIWSPIWLRYFRFGPLEWIWRCLARGHWQPFRLR